MKYRLEYAQSRPMSRGEGEVGERKTHLIDAPNEVEANCSADEFLAEQAGRKKISLLPLHLPTEPVVQPKLEFLPVDE